MGRFGVMLSLVLVLCAVLAIAQTSPVGVPLNSATIPIPLGFIDPLSTQVHLEIPIASVPQRNAPPSTATLVYDPTSCYPSPTWTCGYGTGWQLKMVPLSSTYLAMGTFDYSVWSSSTCPDQAYPYGSVGNVYNIRFTDLHGTVHATGSGSTTPQLTWIACQDAQGNKDPNTGTLHQWTGFSSDGAGYYFNVSYDSTGNLLSEVWAVDGTVVANLPSGGYLGTTNGNNFFGQFAQSPLTADSAYCVPSAPTHVYAKASDASNQTYTINCQNYSISVGTSTTTEIFISSLVLPDGTQYSFSYDTGTSGTHLGGLAGVTLPTGGQLQFTYGPATGCYWIYGYNQTCAPLASATFEGGTWNLSSVTSGSGNSTQTTATVTGPPRYDAASKSYLNDKYVYTSVPGSAPPHIQTIQRYNGATTLLRTVSFTYPVAYGGGCVSSATTTLNDTGQSSQIQYQYWSSLCSLVSQKQEFDFGASSPTRTTKISYQGDTTAIHYNSLYHIYNLPISVSVYTGSGTGSPVSTTNYTYDEYGASYCKNSVPMMTNITGAINHDDAGHGSAFWARGNVTSISKLVSGTIYVTSHACYDTLGNVTQEVDAAGNPTNYDYTENWAESSCIASGILTRAFPTTITDALGHRTKTTRYTCTSLSSAIADENDIQAGRAGTTYTYDWASRPLCTSYTDGGQTCNSYFMAAQPPYSTATTLITSGVSKVTKAIVDGYGRITQGQLTSDPEGTDYTDTQYDAFGRTLSLSNSYRSTSEPTYGVTNFYYDALGRPTSVLQPDSSVATTSYSGNTTTATDEAGHKRKTQVDGLGRLTFVWEDPSGLNYETDYHYDVLNNLIKVTQNGNNSANARIRTFQYNSLSQLTSTANPESGTIMYTYDADGNIITKTAPLPNQTGSLTVTTTSTYDKLNRLTSKSYKDGSVSDPYTPTVQFGYDAVALTNCTTSPPGNTDANPVGRRTAMCDGSGATSWKHDSMGRILSARRTIGAAVGDYETDTYNLDGSPANITVLNYGVTYTSGGAGRPLSAIHNASPTINYVTGATYAPPGELAGATLGSSISFAGFTVSNAYNDRLQPIQLSATTPSATVFNECFDFHLGVAITQPAACALSASTLGDNGNVFQIVNKRDGTHARDQNFIYDSLNRIQQAYSSGSGTYSWGETFSPTATSPGVAPSTPGIDAWGNLTNRSGVTGKANTEPLNCPANTSNQLTTCSYGYDAAGNMTVNGTTSYVYDAENRLVWTNGTPSTRYIYDGDGERAEKCAVASATTACPTSGTTGTLYWRGPLSSDALAESDLAGNTQNTYVFFNGQRVARRDSAGATHYYFSDHLGTHGVVESSTGATCEQDIDYYPYGGVQNDYCGAVPQKYKFTGKERDGESGLDNFGARYNASSLGRWILPDAINITDDRVLNPANTLNKYIYGGNNPLKYVDADGRDITVFYREGLPTGHVMIAAYNQQTGDFAFMSVGPQKPNDLGTIIHPFSGVSGTSEYYVPTSADDLRENFTAVTIQTNPEVAQQAIDAIRSGAGTGNWAAFGNNCTTSCARLLKQIGLSPGSNMGLPWTPERFWENINAKYGKSANALTRLFANTTGAGSFGTPQNGYDSGSPRYGMDTFNWLIFMLSSAPQGNVTTSQTIWVNCQKHPEACKYKPVELN